MQPKTSKDWYYQSALKRQTGRIMDELAKRRDQVKFDLVPNPKYTGEAFDFDLGFGSTIRAMHSKEDLKPRKLSKADKWELEYYAALADHASFADIVGNEAGESGQALALRQINDMARLTLGLKEPVRRYWASIRDIPVGVAVMNPGLSRTYRWDDGGYLLEFDPVNGCWVEFNTSVSYALLVSGKWHESFCLEEWSVLNKKWWSRRHDDIRADSCWDEQCDCGTPIVEVSEPESQELVDQHRSYLLRRYT